MSQFALTNHPCKIDSFNPRAEKHGDENVPAGDIKFSTRVHSSVLDLFDPSYRPFLFRPAESAGDQPGLLPGDKLTSLAKPKLGTLALNEEWPGYQLAIASGLELSEPLVLKDVELSSFRIDAMDGGSVALKFSATVHPDAEQAGALCQAIQDTVEITLTPPAVPAPLVADEAPLGDTLDQQESAEAEEDAEA